MDGITLDRSLAVPPYSEVCSRCKHWRPAEGEHGRTCAAFSAPDSIPLEIWTGKNKHTTPFPGDNGIQFEER